MQEAFPADFLSTTIFRISFLSPKATYVASSRGSSIWSNFTKAVFHLKRIIVIPAIHQSLAPLKRGLRYWHWADVTSHTHLCRLARCYVFVKQSDLPCYCTLYSHTCAYERRDSLYRRYGANLSISLNWFIPAYLSLLS